MAGGRSRGAEGTPRGPLHGRGQILGDPAQPGQDLGAPLHGQGQIPAGPPQPGAYPGGTCTARGTSRGSLHGRGQIPGWRRAEPGDPCTAGAAARPGRGRKGGHPGSSPLLSPTSGVPRPPGVIPGAEPPARPPRLPSVLTELRGGAAAEPPRRAAAAASASAPGAAAGSAPHPPGHRLPAGRNEGGDATSTRAREAGTFAQGLGQTHTHYTMHGSQVMQPPSAQGPCSFKNWGFFLPKKCCHLHTDMLPTGERNSQV